MIARRSFPAASAAVCLAGLLFCLWVLLTGGEALCLTDGCRLFQDFRLAGVSLWQAGSVFFSLLLALCLLHFVRAALLCAALALAADTFLLGVMLFTAPCANCLLVALLTACAFLSLSKAAGSPTPLRSPLLLVWALCFVFNLGGLLRDSAEPWSPLPAQSEAASVHIYFSPSCRACLTLVEQAERIPGARWFPVAEDSRDIWLVRAMAEALNAGSSLPDAIEKARAAVPGLADFEAAPGWRIGLLKPDMLLLQFRLWKNHACVLTSGSDRLPFLQYMGLPAFLRDDTPPPAHEHPAPGTPASPSGPPESMPSIPGLPDLGVAGFCSGEPSSTPCKDGFQPAPTPAPPRGLIDTSGMAQ